jgi:hypothetical protein
MANALQNLEYLAAGIAVSVLLLIVVSVGFYISVPTKKSKQCVRNCPFLLWSITNTVTGAMNTAVDIMYTLWSFGSIRNIFGGLILVTAAVATFQFHDTMLQSTDDAWKVWIYPLLHDVVEPLILLARFFYNIGAPLYNLYISVMYQLVRGSAVIIGKCQVEGLYLPLRHISNATIHFSEATVDFILDPSRPINITDGARDTLLAAHTLQNGLKCACKQTELVTDVIFYGGNVKAFAFAANSLANVPIQLIRDLTMAVAGGAITAPTFARTFDFINDAVLKTGVGLDEWAYYAVDKYGIIDKTKAPERSVFTAAAYTGVAAVSIPEDILSGSLNLLNSPTKQQIQESYMFDTAWRSVDVAAQAVGETLHFFLEYYATEITREDFHPYSCEWDIDDQTFERLSIAVGCGAEHALKTFAGLPHVVWSAALTSIFKSATASDVLTIMQRHDGTWLNRGKGLLSCEYRKEHSLVDGQPPPYLEVDHTVNSENCVCEVDSFYTDPMVGYKYNPWCGQPTLQAQVFNHAETTVVILSKAVFGPLAGLVNGPPRLFIEALRIVVRLAFSIPDMVEGQWAQRQLGCGYGVDNNACDDAFTHIDRKCENNANGDCYCDWEKPITADSNCRCIADFPIFTTTFEETQSVNNAFQKASPRWCNTMVFEHMLQTVEESGQSLSFIFNWLGKEINAAMSLGKKCYHYEVASLSTTAQLGGFTVDTEQSATACNAWGHENVFCGLGGSSTAFFRLVTSTYRQAAVNVIKLLQGDVAALQLDLSPRICDAERVLSMMASSLSGTLIFAEFPQREAVGKLLFSIGDGLFVVPLKIVHRTYYTLVSVLQNIVATGRLNADEVSNAFKTLIVDHFNSIFDVLKLLMTSFEQFFNTLGSGNPKPGAIFATLRGVLEALQEVFTTSFLDILAELSNIGIQFVSILTGQTNFGGGVVSMLRSVAAIIGEFVTIAASNIMLLLDAILSLLGPFGEVLKVITGSMCNLVKEIAGLEILKMLGVDGSGIQCFGNTRRLAATHNNEEMTITTWAHTVLTWEDNTLCDEFMSRTDAHLDELSVLEQATWRDCLTKRLIGEKIQELVGLPKLKLYDIAYNYQRAPLVAYEVFENFRVSYGIQRRTEVYAAFLDAHMDPQLHMGLYDAMSAFSKGAWRAVELTANDVQKQKLDGTGAAAAFSTIMKSLKTLNTRKFVSEQKVFWSTLDVATHLVNTTAVTNPFHSVFQQYARNTEVVATTVTTGAAIYTDISGGGPLQCTIVDNMFVLVKDHANAIASFYSSALPSTIEDFETYSQRPSFESKLNTANITGASFDTSGEISRWKLAGQDWQNLFDGERLTRADLEFFLDASTRFITTTNSSYVPLYGIGLPYTIIYPIFESCDTAKHVFVDETVAASQEERVANIPMALQAVIIYTIAIQFSSWWSPLPIAFLGNIILLAVVNGFIYMYMVYEYLPSCYPNVPYTLTDDFYVYVSQNRAQENFCEYFPLLYNSTGGCGSTLGSAAYSHCADLIAGFEKGEVSETGNIMLGSVMWPTVTWLRRLISFPMFIAPYVSGESVEQWKAGFALSDAEIECSNIMLPAAVFGSGVIAFSIYAAVKILIGLARLALNAFIVVFHVYNLSQDVIEQALDYDETPAPVETQRAAEEKKREEKKKKREEEKKREKKVEKDIDEIRKALII